MISVAIRPELHELNISNKTVWQPEVCIRSLGKPTLALFVRFKVVQKNVRILIIRQWQLARRNPTAVISVCTKHYNKVLGTQIIKACFLSIIYSVLIIL